VHALLLNAVETQGAARPQFPEFVSEYARASSEGQDGVRFVRSEIHPDQEDTEGYVYEYTHRGYFGDRVLSIYLFFGGWEAVVCVDAVAAQRDGAKVYSGEKKW